MKNKRRNMMLIAMIGIAVMFVVILSPLFLESYDPVWETMTCDEMLDWSASPAHDVMGDRGHMEFHNYYYNNCMNEEQVNIDDMTYDEFMDDLGVMREEIREERKLMQNMSLTDSIGITDSIEVRNTNNLSIELVDSLGVTDSVTITNNENKTIELVESLGITDSITEELK